LPYEFIGVKVLLPILPFCKNYTLFQGLLMRGMGNYKEQSDNQRNLKTKNVILALEQTPPEAERKPPELLRWCPRHFRHIETPF
jgi:hypothetical protein